LIGLGRWGTLDPWLGIPVSWENINGASAIVEANFFDYPIELSQGSHFFQNLTSFKVGYFTVSNNSEHSFIDWDWLLSQKVNDQKKFTRHVKLNYPITIKIDGLKGKGIIIKPSLEK
jgi:hypothetical protein